jgi:hypothetical protein
VKRPAGGAGGLPAAEVHRKASISGLNYLGIRSSTTSASSMKHRPSFKKSQLERERRERQQAKSARRDAKKLSRLPRVTSPSDEPDPHSEPGVKTYLKRT